MPMPFQNLTICCWIKIQNGFAFLLPAYPSCPFKKPLNWCATMPIRLSNQTPRCKYWSVHCPAMYVKAIHEDYHTPVPRHTCNNEDDDSMLTVVYWGGGYMQVYGVYQPPGFFWQHILTSVIINKQGTFRPFATPLCVYPPPFLAIHHCMLIVHTVGRQIHTRCLTLVSSWVENASISSFTSCRSDTCSLYFSSWATLTSNSSFSCQCIKTITSDNCHSINNQNWSYYWHLDSWCYHPVYCMEW